MFRYSTFEGSRVQGLGLRIYGTNAETNSDGRYDSNKHDPEMQTNKPLKICLEGLLGAFLGQKSLTVYTRRKSNYILKMKAPVTHNTLMTLLLVASLLVVFMPLLLAERTFCLGHQTWLPYSALPSLSTLKARKFLSACSWQWSQTLNPTP